VHFVITKANFGHLNVYNIIKAGNELSVGWERKSADSELFRSMLIDGGEARLSCSLFTSAACESLHYRYAKFGVACLQL